jgi:hypothetical protein
MENGSVFSGSRLKMAAISGLSATIRLLALEFACLESEFMQPAHCGSEDYRHCLTAALPMRR